VVDRLFSSQPTIQTDWSETRLALRRIVSPVTSGFWSLQRPATFRQRAASPCCDTIAVTSRYAAAIACAPLPHCWGVQGCRSNSSVDSLGTCCTLESICPFACTICCQSSANHRAHRPENQLPHRIFVPQRCRQNPPFPQGDRGFAKSTFRPRVTAAVQAG